ncbi:MAG: DHH family phosphoesterase [Chitinophagales bacterium]|nr:DHH family phosphoesterase [Chitinophagales bacterium]
MENFDALSHLLASPKKIVITTHQNPDGDAMGSSLAMWQYLKKKGHQVTVVVPTNYPDFLKWLPGDKEVLIFPYQHSKSKQLVDEAEVIFCLDFNALSRINDLGQQMKLNTRAFKVLIDHHLEPENFADASLWKVSASSTAELVYEFIQLNQDAHLIDKDMADCIYTGLLTDTGGFQHPNTTPKVMHIAAEMLDRGIDPSYIYRMVFNSFTELRLRLFGYCITEKLQIVPELRTAIIALDRNELVKFQVRSGDTEGIVNYPLKISTINLSAFVVDRTEMIKLSFRSIGSFDVNTFARKHFNGGGHHNAAGGTSHDSLEQTLKKLETLLPQYKEQLVY